MTVLGVIFIAIVCLSVYGYIDYALHKYQSGDAYDEIKKIMRW